MTALHCISVLAIDPDTRPGTRRDKQMTRNNLLLKSALLIMSFGLLINLAVPEKAFSYYGFPGWERGAFGYELALVTAHEEERPLIMYFYIDPSTWNDRMNDEYLSTYEIDRFLENIPKVHINPDEGDAESALAIQYSVDQFPAFLVLIPSFNNKPQRIHPFSDQDMTKEEFLNEIKKNIVYEYNNKASECVEKKDYGSALKYLEMSIDYDANNAYTYYAIGVAYNFQAAEKNDAELLKKAEENYSKALEIDPGHEASAEALEKLQQGTKK
jgi:tetratricopeptide (TPR) repeat protein